jgi:hypothetical protein
MIVGFTTTYAINAYHHVQIGICINLAGNILLGAGMNCRALSSTLIASVINIQR